MSQQFLTVKYFSFLHLGGVFNKAVIPLTPVGCEIIL